MRSIGIEINSSCLRLVEMEQQPDGVRLVSAVTTPTFWFADTAGPFATSGAEQQAARFAELDALLERYAQAGVTVRGGVTGISGRELMLRFVDVPDRDEKRQAIVLKFEIDDILEQAEEELAYDHTVLFDPNAAGTQTAVLALAKDAYLQRLHDRLAELKLAPTRITPSCLALYHAFLMGAESREDETLLIASVGCEETELCLVRDGGVVFARNLNVGLKGLAEVVAEEKGLAPDKAYRHLLSKVDITPNPSGGRDGSRLQVQLWDQADQLHRALEASLTFARIHLKAPSLKPNRVLLAGDMARLAGGRQFLLQRFRLPVELFNPFSLLEHGEKRLPDGLRRGEWDASKVPAAYAVAAGLARIGLDSQPAAAVKLEAATVRAKREFVHRTVFLYAGALAALLMLAWMIVASYEYAWTADEQRQQAQATAQAVRSLKDRLIAAEAEVEAARPLVQALRAAVEPTAHALAVQQALRAFANENPETIVEEISLDPPTDGGPAGQGGAGAFDRPATMRFVVVFENKGRVESGTLIERLLEHLEAHASEALRPGGLLATQTHRLEGLGERYEIRATLRTPKR